MSPTGRSKILDYLWVSCTDGISSHVTAFRSQQNTLKEVSAFDLVEEKINDLLFVSGHVWVATDSRKYVNLVVLTLLAYLLKLYVTSNAVHRLNYL